MNNTWDQGADVSNGKWWRTLRQRRTAVFALAIGIAVAAVSTALTALPSGASATAGSAVPASAIPALRSHMLRLARLSDDAHPASIRAVVTTRAKAMRAATPGDTIPGVAHQAAYLVVMKGTFKVDAPVPRGAHLPTGRYLAVTVDPATFQVMDLGLSNHPPPVPLRSYGPVSNLAK